MAYINRDPEGRLRNTTVACKVSITEKHTIETMCKLSGKTHQDYVRERLLNTEMNVIGNPRAYIGIKRLLEEMIVELRAIKSKRNAIPSEQMLKDIELIVNTIKLMEENIKEGK